MQNKFLTALPVYNEVENVAGVLAHVARNSENVLVVDDGSNDGTSELLRTRDDIVLLAHPKNRGYGAALMTAFDYAIEQDYEILVTIDCDGQHEPQLIREMVEVCESTGADIVSGSRYLNSFDQNTAPPAQRRWINARVTRDLNDRLGFNLTDAFCGFKAYRVNALRRIKLTETGYAMPLELWVQAACARLKIQELAVPLIYLDENRSFGGPLDDGATRLNYYNTVLQHSFKALPDECWKLRTRAPANV